MADRRGVVADLGGGEGLLAALDAVEEVAMVASRTAIRVHKILEDANIKLGSVATNILGVSGRGMIEALIRGGTEVGPMAELARGRLRAALTQAVWAASHSKQTYLSSQFRRLAGRRGKK
ncbi:MAG: hypothetical protein GX455_04950 [Phycisphaerae bacterium]|nr:hypothetical protein [Phycisphaerae bacterium]